jgi:Dolichyl-phosphate-mannose-protein mannosyltransferase
MTGRPRTTAALFVAAVVLPVAALSRLWAIDFCLPHPHCRPDEDAIMAIAGAFRTGHFDPGAFNYPALFMLTVAAAMRLPTIGERLLHKITPFHFSPLLSDEATTATYTLTARGLSAAAGIASVWIVFRLGLRLFDRAAAVAGASLLALAFLHVRDSHYGVTDVPMSFMVLIAALCAVRLSQSGARKDLALAGIAAGLAAATKYNGGLVALPVLFAVFVNPAAKPLGARVADAAIAAALMVAAFLCASPYTVIEFRRFWNDFSSDAMHLSGGHGIDLGRGWIYHANTTLRYGVGTPLLVSGAAGMLLLLWRDVRKGVLVALFPAAYYGLMGSGHTVFTRHMIPVVPFLCLAAGYFLAESASWLAALIGRPAWRAALTAAAVALVLWPSARSVVMFDSLLARDDSRLIVRRWIEQRFPAGTTIAQIAPDGGVVFWHDASEVAYTTTVDLSHTGARPAVVIVQSSPLQPPLDNMGEVEAALKAEYSLAFVQHVVTADPANVYDLQDEFYLPLTGFRHIGRPGPNLDVYVLTSR